jgi:predicted TIM-barrel fold metal-dependent hydrolase
MRERVLHVKRVNGQDRWFIEGDIDFGQVGTTIIDPEGGKILGRLGLSTYDELHEASWDVKARHALMDRLGIWAQIVYPNAIGFSATQFLRVRDRDLRNLCIRIYNDAVAEWQRESNGRLFPQALVPFWDIELATKEAQRVVEELHLTGIAITDRPEAFRMPDYGQPEWQPFWEYIDHAGIPLNFHVGSGATVGPGTPGAPPWPSFGPERHLAIFACLFALDNARMVANLIYSGLFDRYPHLKFVSVESGIGWIPYLLEAAEYQLDEMCPTEKLLLQRRPNEFFRDHIYACFWFEDFGPRKMLEAIGEKNILFETDFPHPTCLYPKSQEHVANVLRDLEPGIRRRVLQDNAAELYRLPLPV